MAKRKIQDCTQNGVYAPDNHDRVILRVDSQTLILPKREKVVEMGKDKVVEEWQASLERGRKMYY
jgi:hypothetical protein